MNWSSICVKFCHLLNIIYSACTPVYQNKVLKYTGRSCTLQVKINSTLRDYTINIRSSTGARANIQKLLKLEGLFSRTQRLFDNTWDQVSGVQPDLLPGIHIISWHSLAQIFLSCCVAQSSFLHLKVFAFRSWSLVFCCRMVLLLLLIASPCQGLEW